MSLLDIASLVVLTCGDVFVEIPPDMMKFAKEEMGLPINEKRPTNKEIWKFLRELPEVVELHPRPKIYTLTWRD